MANYSRILRMNAALDAAGNKPCPNGCGHLVTQHRELPRMITTIENNALVERLNPDYKPLHFHCEADGCQCIRIRS